MRIALYQPDIAGNVGAILRTAACMGIGVDLIEPMGFTWSEKAVARSGMDYVGAVDVVRHVDWDAFLAQARGRIVLLTTRGAVRLDVAAFRDDDILLFGPESRGLPADVLDELGSEHCLRLPMQAGSRSLNLSNAVAVVVYEAWRQSGFIGGR